MCVETAWSTGKTMTNLIQNPFSSAAFYGRPAPTRTYTGDSVSGTVFGNNIWQSDSRSDLAARRDPGRQSGKVYEIVDAY